VNFSTTEVAQRTAWLNCPVIRVRVAVADTASYEERVRISPDGRVAGVSRRYHPSVSHSVRVLLTRRRDVARGWMLADTPREGLAAAVKIAGRTGVTPASVKGQAAAEGDTASVATFMRILAGSWKHPGRAIDGIYQHRPGVWVHETSVIDPGAAIAGPLWIGAGVQLAEQDAACGPDLIPDAVQVGGPAALDWERIQMPQWDAMPALRQTTMYRMSKRAFDVLFSAAALVCLFPLFPLIMLAIWREDGRPFFFAHRRQTIHGRNFRCWKFRTMIRNSDSIKEKLVAANEVDGPQFYIRDDPRVLRIGKFLRKSNLDELPQFWNVLMGDMSIVGPRPSPDKENQFCPGWREARLSVRPGITGLWQVRRTRDPLTDFQEWIRYDLEYVQSRSWSLDLWILAHTLRVVLKLNREQRS
jgi:lipopolysaccharide/colanic/teichoic acid biosynthesis glycosyltransferase